MAEKNWEEEVKMGKTPGGEMDIDEDNVVIFYDKTNLDKFYSEYEDLLNYLYVHTKKFFMPSILCNSPRDLKRESLIVLRNCEKVANY